MVMIIPLTRGYVTLVDDEDYADLIRFSWSVVGTDDGSRSDNLYATRGETVDGKIVPIRMHRYLMGEPKGLLVDHRNHDTLDNQKHNLRLATHAQNNQNRRKLNAASSQYKGVHFQRKNGKFIASIRPPGGQQLYLGIFADEWDAAQTYNAAALQHFGEFAQLNKLSQPWA